MIENEFNTMDEMECPFFCERVQRNLLFVRTYEDK